MSFRTRLTSLCIRIFSCFSFAQDLTDEGVDQDVESEIREILSELPIESITGVCKPRSQSGKKLLDVEDCSDSSCLSELHNSMIHGVLTKLPVKSIIRCRYVCTSWYKLISEPYFSKVYFKNLTLTYIAFRQHKYLIRCSGDEFFGFLEISQNGNVRRNPMNMKALTSPVTSAKKSCTSIIGSCDGLLCLVEIPYEDCYTVSYHFMDRLRSPNQTVWIVNPLIGEYMELPRVHGDDNHTVLYGFGSVVDGEHYKVLRIVRKNYGRVMGAHILTISVDEKWRALDISTFPPLLYSHGVTLNGVLHWIGFSRTRRFVIYVFDIGKETGQSFVIPFEPCIYNSYLGIRDGHLCIIDNKKNQVDLWTMKQYGVLESWKTDIILKKNSSSGFHPLVPVTTMSNGDLLLVRQYDQSLLSFDPKTKKCVELEVFKNDELRFYMFSFTPSFVSLPGMVSRLLERNNNQN